MRLWIAAMLALLAAPAGAQTIPGLPTGALPGECYAPVLIPARYDTFSETVEAEPAREVVVPVPARYEWVEEQVTLPATTRREVITPAVVEWQEKTVDVPARTRTVTVPARYRTVTDRVPTGTRSVLKKGKPLPGETEEVWCLVEEPDGFTTTTRRELVQPARQRTETVAARSRTVRTRTVITPAVTQRVAVPARTVTRRVKRLVEPASTRVDYQPARYEPRERRTLIEPERLEWRAVLCETNATPERFMRLQAALQDRGHYRGALDGRFGPQTRAALAAWQQSENLPQGLTTEALVRLGVMP